MVPGGFQREQHVPRTRDKREANGLQELTPKCRFEKEDREYGQGGECSLAKEWEMKLERQRETRS